MWSRGSDRSGGTGAVHRSAASRDSRVGPVPSLGVLNLAIQVAEEHLVACPGVGEPLGNLSLPSPSLSCSTPIPMSWSNVPPGTPQRWSFSQGVRSRTWAESAGAWQRALEQLLHLHQSLGHPSATGGFPPWLKSHSGEHHNMIQRAFYYYRLKWQGLEHQTAPTPPTSCACNWCGGWTSTLENISCDLRNAPKRLRIRFNEHIDHCLSN